MIISHFISCHFFFLFFTFVCVLGLIEICISWEEQIKKIFIFYSVTVLGKCQKVHQFFCWYFFFFCQARSMLLMAQMNSPVFAVVLYSPHFVHGRLLFFVFIVFVAIISFYSYHLWRFFYNLTYFIVVVVWLFCKNPCCDLWIYLYYHMFSPRDVVVFVVLHIWSPCSTLTLRKQLPVSGKVVGYQMRP